jgi:lysophospholipase L1-like esterase
MRNTKFLYLMVLAIIFWQCELSVDEFQPSAGELDLSSYVALGDSYSAGYTDGALGYESQIQSLPAILAQQFALAGGGEFIQPLMPEGSSVGSDGKGYYKLHFINGSHVPQPSDGDISVFANRIGSEGPFNNMAVPGAKSFHLLADAFSSEVGGNPFFTRFASEPGATSIMEDAGEIDHSFFSLWIGGNDVLTYALTGGTADLITPVANFNQALNAIVTRMVGSGKSGVIANIPDIEALPYFNLVPYNALPLTQAQADQLNAAYAGYNMAANSVGRPAIVFVEGANPMLIEDSKMTDMPAQARFRQLLPGEKLLLNTPTAKIATEGWGSQVPIPEKYGLDLEDIQDIKEATTEYNTIIKQLAADNNLAFVDLFSLMNELKSGLVIDGNTYSNTFASGGIFSLDGIHATYRGYAVIANEFIRAINAQYNAQIPLVNINDYATVIFP